MKKILIVNKEDKNLPWFGSSVMTADVVGELDDSGHIIYVIKTKSTKLGEKLSLTMFGVLAVNGDI